LDRYPPAFNDLYPYLSPREKELIGFWWQHIGYVSEFPTDEWPARREPWVIMTYNQVGAGSGSWRDVPTTAKGGRPARVFVVSTASTVYESSTKPDET
jgi:hypothetical protein